MTAVKTGPVARGLGPWPHSNGSGSQFRRSVSLPIVGFILGIVWLVRSKIGDGAGLIAFSLIGSAIWYATLLHH
jgi:hypothetical protein